MYAIINGKKVPVTMPTPEEKEMLEQYRKEHPEEFTPAPPTEAERLEALESQLAGIVSAYREGVNEA